MAGPSPKVAWMDVPDAEMKRKIEDNGTACTPGLPGLLAARAGHIGDPGLSVTQAW